MMNTLRLPIAIPALLGTALLAVALGFHAAPANAVTEETTGEQDKVISKLPTETVGQQASEILSRINKAIDNGRHYDQVLESASQEDQKVLQLQIYQLRVQIMNDVNALAETLLQMESSGPQAELRTEVEEVFTRITPLVRFHIDRYRQEVDAVRARRIEVKPEERATLEAKVEKLSRRVDTYHRLGLEYFNKMQALGMPTDDTRKDFIFLLNERVAELTGRIDLALERIQELDKLNKETPNDAGIVSLLSSAQRSLKTNITSLEVVLGLMDALELDTRSSRARLVTLTHDISSGILDTGVAMSLVSTSLLTIDNQLYIVPNSKIWGDVIKNVTAQKIRRVDMVFGISYSDDIENAEAVLADILKSHTKVLDEPESVIRLHTLGESSVDFIVRPWVKVDDYWDVYWDITRTVKMRFDTEMS